MANNHIMWGQDDNELAEPQYICIYLDLNLEVMRDNEIMVISPMMIPSISNETTDATLYAVDS